MVNKRLYVAIGILSASIIAFQFALMQNLSVVQWNHFAYMIISVALLGFGASGTLLSLFRNQFIRNYVLLLPLLFAMSAVCMSSVMFLTKNIIPGFDIYMIFSDTREIGRLVLVYLVYFLPFFFGGAALGLVYTRHSSSISSLYFADLVGAAMGGALLTALLWVMYPWQLSSLLSLLPMIGAFLVLDYRKNKRIFIFLIFCAFISVYFISRKDIPAISQYKSLSKTLAMQGAKVILEKGSPYGHLHVVSSPALRFAPGLSLNWTQTPPKALAFFNNGNWFGAIPLGKSSEKYKFYDYTLYALPFVCGMPEKVLMPDAGTAPFASFCLTKGVSSVTLVEENIVAVNLLKNRFAGIHDSLLYHPLVKIREGHSRSLLLSDTVTYDLIVFPDVGSFGGISGVMAVSEQYLFTVEAFRNAWDRLSHTGYLMINVWLDYPVRAPLKLLSTIKETLERNNVLHPETHILLVRSWCNAVFLVKKSAITPVEVDRVRQYCLTRSFDPVVPANILPKETGLFNILPDESFGSYIDSILYGNTQRFQARYPFDVTPASDNQPYFYRFFKPTHYCQLKEQYGFRSLAYLEPGYFFIFITLFQILAAEFVLIILPLLFLRVKGPGIGFTLIYFSALGIGFMFVEIVLIQQFILFLGQPIYAAAAVISLMLFFSGTGSFFSGRYPADKIILKKVLVAIVSLILLYALILNSMLGRAIYFSAEVKIVYSVLLISPLAFVMGMAFPLGIRIISNRNKLLVPWAWGVNGCASVISTVLATIVAMHFGFQDVTFIAAGAYFVSLLAMLLWKKL